MRASFLGALLAAALGACSAAVAHSLQRESARAITPTPYPDSVTISELRRNRLGVPTQWVATTPGGVYDCTLEANEQHPLCARRTP